MKQSKKHSLKLTGIKRTQSFELLVKRTYNQTLRFHKSVFSILVQIQQSKFFKIDKSIKMQINKRPFPLVSLAPANSIRARIDTNPEFQRPAVWTVSQKQLLIDTILRGYDIPKMYWHRTGTNPDRYEVVDGQQRLRAIWGFVDGDFKLPVNAEPIGDYVLSGISYLELPDDLRMQFDTYSVDVVVLDDTDGDEVREMFLRLQNGTSLKAQEKRNAMPGQMREFIRGLTGHLFFQRVTFQNKRFAHDHVAAQLVCLEIAGEPVNIKDADLNRMYRDNINFDVTSSVGRSVTKRLNFLSEIFPEKMPELERFNVIALYCVFAELQRSYAFINLNIDLKQWFLNFEGVRREQEELDEDAGSAEWVTYKEKISHSTDAEESIRYRTDFLMRYLLTQYPDISLKDNQREFTHSQRIAIFRRDRQICQLRIVCDGIKVDWDNWHCDHIVAHTNGGSTTVSNGQVACPRCNLAKGAA